LRKNVEISDATPFKLDEERENYWIDQLKQIDRVWKVKE
jgi:hypothetical protein